MRILINQSEVFGLFREGMSTQEIATKLSFKPNSISKILSKAGLSHVVTSKDDGFLRRSKNIARFISKLPSKPNENGCWIWQGSFCKDGYGRSKVDGKESRAHRLSYLYHVGDFPSDTVVRHSCDEPACVNPCHLILGTHLDNMRDKVERNRSLRGSKNPHYKGVDLMHPLIIEMRSNGASLNEIAKSLNISQRSVWNQVHKKEEAQDG